MLQLEHVALVMVMLGNALTVQASMVKREEFVGKVDYNIRFFDLFRTNLL